MPEIIGKRILKNGTVAGYVKQTDGSYRWSFISRYKKVNGGASAKSRSSSPGASAKKTLPKAKSRSSSPGASAKSRSSSPGASAKSRSSSPGASAKKTLPKAKSRSSSPGASAKKTSSPTAELHSLCSPDELVGLKLYRATADPRFFELFGPPINGVHFASGITGNHSGHFAGKVITNKGIKHLYTYYERYHSPIMGSDVRNNENHSSSVLGPRLLTFIIKNDHIGSIRIAKIGTIDEELTKLNENLRANRSSRASIFNASKNKKIQERIKKKYIEWGYHGTLDQEGTVFIFSPFDFLDIIEIKPYCMSPELNIVLNGDKSNGDKSIHIYYYYLLYMLYPKKKHIYKIKTPQINLLKKIKMAQNIKNILSQEIDINKAQPWITNIIIKLYLKHIIPSDLPELPELLEVINFNNQIDQIDKYKFCYEH